MDVDAAAGSAHGTESDLTGPARFAREVITPALCEEFWPLLDIHYREVSHYPDIQLDPDFDLYTKMDQMGMLRIFTCRKSGELIGYAIFFVKHNPHYKGSLQANQDVLFIHPEHRGRGVKFILWCDQQLKADGVEIVYQRSKVRDDLNFGKLLERIGYEQIDITYGRRL